MVDLFQYAIGSKLRERLVVVGVRAMRKFHIGVCMYHTGRQAMRKFHTDAPMK